MLSGYLQPKWVQAGVCPAANWAVSLNLHGIQQVLITETGRPADLELCLANTAGTVVVKLENEREQSCQDVALLGLIRGSRMTRAIMRLS